MLKEWLEQIKKENDYAQNDLWEYRISGNVLELYIRKPNQNKQSSYRLAVIEIGRVIEKISEKCTHHQAQLLIQSFPNLAEMRLVAALRINNETGTQETENRFGGFGGTAEERLQKLIDLAGYYQLSLKKVPEHISLIPVTPEFMKNSNWFALCSDHDNPFTWLKSGYWLEKVDRIYAQNGMHDKPVFYQELPDGYNFHSSENPKQRHFVQMLAAIS